MVCCSNGLEVLDPVVQITTSLVKVSLKFQTFISSPEHEVLMVSYCDQSMSVVRRASCVVNNLF